MNSKRIFAIVALGAALLSKTNANAQSDNDNHNVKFVIPEIAFLDLETEEKSKTVTLTVKAPENAGDPVDLSEAVDKSLWINYTSIVGGGKRRTVTAEIAKGEVPGGLDLNVYATKASKDNKGIEGEPASEITLDKKAQEIITGISSCYTGNGANKGHQLVYSLEMSENGDDFGDFDYEENNNEITVLYTITDDI